MSHLSWKRALVTGGAGAIGSRLANTLRAGGCEVAVLDDLSSGDAGKLDPGIAFVQGSVTSDRDLDRAFATAPDVVFHLAALFANQNSVEHPCRDIDVNGLGMIKVLQWSQRHAVRKLLYTSSSCVYGASPEMREDAAAGSTDTPYAITKYLGEMYCRFWSSHHGLDTAIVRLFNSYGPGELPGRYRNVIPNFFSLAMQGKPLPITGTGDEVRDFNYVDDTVDGMIRVMSCGTVPGSVYNLGSGKGTTILDLAGMINRIAGNPAGIAFVPRRSWDTVTRRIGNIGKARAGVGYEPRVALPEGLARTHEWLKAHLPR
jgi:nucleoside-diphosphate-sugar epimerase